MRGLRKILFGFAICTLSLLVYVHGQVELLRISYRIHKKSSELGVKTEEFRRLSFEVGRLRSPANLEKRLEKLSLSLALPKEIQVLRVGLPETYRAIPQIPVRIPTSKFLDFLGQWIQVAQARTDQ